MIVVDASAVVEALFRTATANTLRRRLFDPRQTLHAPHLIDVEVAQVIRRFAANGQIDEQRGRAALGHLADLPMHRHSQTVLLPRIWSLRANLTAYDAAYVALAEVLDAPLITCDRRLAAAPGHRAVIELV